MPDHPALPQRRRIASVDVLRGIIMVLMALDHVRDFTSRVHFQPEDLSRSWPALFATRWITHFCAPSFFLLAGVGIGILRGRGEPRGALTRFLLTRGLWLLILELVITPVGWRFSFDLLPFFGLVLWALGWSMILMAALLWLPTSVVATVSLVMIGGHNLLDAITAESLGRWGPIWHVLHAPGLADPRLIIAYPLIPWVGVMGAGYALAQVYRWEPARRRRFLLAAGTAASLLFVAIRAVNGYGNPRPWVVQGSPAMTLASFLNVQKYPPSLDFLLMTLGPALVALALLERATGRVAGWFEVYGRVPLFFYATHIFVVHFAGVLLALAQGHVLMRIPAVLDPGSIPPWYGLSLPGVYVAWMLVVLALYYPCRRFSELKATRRDWWLRYL